ncbi:MAG: tetratricopeptide repeat protein [Ignavibacteriaceae bacterium]|nr:tetratricopeptide repeat protein [Ignavibacteriaceae bacterium]
MRTKLLSVTMLLVISFIFTGYQCSSTEITSARLYIQQKNYEKALEVIEKEISKNPKSDEGYYLKGLAYFSLENLPEMVTAFDKSLQISKKFQAEIEDIKLRAWVDSFNKGVALVKRGAQTQDQDSAKVFYDLAISSFESAALIEPDSSDAYNNIAIVYINQKKYQEAIEPYKKSLQLNPTEDAHIKLAELYYVLGVGHKNKFDNERASRDSVEAYKYFNSSIDVLEQGYKSYPKSVDIIKLLAELYSQTQQTTKGIATFKSAVDYNPDNAEYRFYYGYFLLTVGQYSDAVNELEKARQLDPKDTDILYTEAVAYFNWGIALRQEAEKLEKESPEANDKFNKAREILEDLIALKNDQAKYFNLAGKVYSLLGMTAEATAAFEKEDELRK